MAMKLFKNKKQQPRTSSEKKSENQEFFSVLRVYIGKLVPYLPVFVLILILSFWYIDNRYVCEKQMRRVAELEKELQDKKYSYLTTRSELTHFSRQSVVVSAVNERGLDLHVPTTPPIKIKN